MKIADMVIQKKLLLNESKQLPTADNIRAIREDLEPLARAWTPQILNDPKDDKPFIAEIEAVHQAQLQTNKKIAEPTDAQRIIEEARQLRLAAIEATIKDISEGDVEVAVESLPEKLKKPAPLAPIIRH